ncbi:mechanosensitive ion channel domain-containing protein [Methylocapsa sp. S129]|uniref:mechanosensitive ion channel domain-containing protein n=1 Tax=Methylocapsa sp. S129 TaxID=1641869 RepID=UPI00131BEE83|nr:mechanosensitive ion channel domain-containing protein [Methylocapsa sp. S129]
MTKTTLCVLIVTLFAIVTAHAQTVAPNPNPADTPAGSSSLTPAEAERALNVLGDADKRAQLIETLQTVAKASSPIAPAKPVQHAPAAPLSLKPDSLGAQLVVQATGWAEDFSDEIVATARATTDLPLLWRGMVSLSSDTDMQAAALNAGWRLALVLGCALAIEALVGFVLRRPRAALEVEPQSSSDVAQRPHDETPIPRTLTLVEDISSSPTPPGQAPSGGANSLRLLRRLPLALLRLALSLLPVGAFAAAGALLAATEVGASASTRLIIFEALKAYILCRAIVCVARMLVSPSNRRLRLLHMGDQTAAYIEIWVRRIAVVAVFGATFVEAAQLLEWNAHIHHAMVKLVALVVNLFLLTIVLQCRAPIAKQIRAAEGAHGSLAMLRNRLAGTWHFIAIFVIVTLWFVWAARLQDGLSRSLQLILMTIAVIVVARLGAILVLGLLDRMFHVNLDMAKRFPGLEERANRYYPLLRGAVSILIGWVTLVALFETWGFDALVWFQGDAIGGRLVSALVTIAIAAAAAVAVWEGANAAAEAHLARLAREARYARSARLRTLLPMLRSSLLIVIIAVVGLTVLSEIGVNIAPLLAGAGIIGIAIGFGSQKLVQDLITGLFLLLENAMQVGDWVTVSGLSGSVENLSIRTIRLRAGDGSVHIVPFSSVTSVTNSNRGVGNAAISVSVAYEEDTDRVGETLKEIAAAMRQEAQFKAMMLGDMQLWGVDKLDGASATIVGQITCTDSGRWAVQREFNRRMKRRFQELGVIIAAPNQSILIKQASGSPDPGGELDETTSSERSLAHPVAHDQPTETRERSLEKPVASMLRGTRR